MYPVTIFYSLITLQLGKNADVKNKSAIKIAKTIIDFKIRGKFAFFNIYNTNAAQDANSKLHPVLPATEFFPTDGTT